MTDQGAPAGRPINVGAGSSIERRLNLLRWYRGFLPPGRSSPLDLLMIQPTPFCNIDCKYCYLPHRSKKGRFPLELLDPLFGKLLKAGLIGNSLSVLWHAGEPMVLPPAYYADAIDRIGRLAGTASRIAHIIQTNGTLITQEWCDLIRAKGIRIGVSIDGPEHIHDANRVTRSKNGTFENVMNGIRLLDDNGISFSVIAVVTARSVDRPDEIYDFFKHLGASQTGFNVDEIEGFNATSSLAGPGMEERYRRFMARVLQRSLQDRSLMRIREFANSVMRFGGGLAGQEAYSSEANPFSILSCDMNGKLFTFSPELVDLTSRDGGDYSIGDIQTIEFDRIYQEPRFAAMNGEIQAGVAQCRETCSYFSACGGGAPVNKLAENGTFNSTETMFCRCKYKIAADVVDDHILQSIAQRRKPWPDRESGGLARGLSVVVPASAGRRLRISDGTGGRELARDAGLYDPSARLPLATWREPTDDEMRIIAAGEEGAGPLSFVAIVRPPAEIIEPVRRMAFDLIEGRDRRPGLDGESAPVVDRVGSALAAIFSAPDRTHRTLGIGVFAPGLATTTVDGSTQRRLGLHVDSWSELPPGGRSEAPNRLCVNLGREPRRLLFINLPLEKILSRLSAAAVGDPDMGATELARLFMRLFPGYPVLSLEIAPGEAYIAPTEITIHDGCTLGMDSRDVCLTVIGHFVQPRI